MLDSLFAKCLSVTHFQSVVGLIEQIASVLKTSFGGPLEQETLDIITTLIGTAAQTPSVTPVVTPEVPATPVVTSVAPVTPTTSP